MKAINCMVYRFPLGDCTINGITARNESVWLFSEDSTDEEIKEFMEKRGIDHKCAMRIKKRPAPYTNFAEVVFKRSAGAGTYMSGGNYLHTSDSRYYEITGVHYPVSAHDRFEDWDMYDALSK